MLILFVLKEGRTFIAVGSGLAARNEKKETTNELRRDLRSEEAGILSMKEE